MQQIKRPNRKRVVQLLVTLVLLAIFFRPFRKFTAPLDSPDPPAPQDVSPPHLLIDMEALEEQVTAPPRTHGVVSKVKFTPALGRGQIKPWPSTCIAYMVGEAQLQYCHLEFSPFQF